MAVGINMINLYISFYVWWFVQLPLTRKYMIYHTTLSKKYQLKIISLMFNFLYCC